MGLGVMQGVDLCLSLMYLTFVWVYVCMSAYLCVGESVDIDNTICGQRLFLSFNKLGEKKGPTLAYWAFIVLDKSFGLGQTSLKPPQVPLPQPSFLHPLIPPPSPAIPQTKLNWFGYGILCPDIDRVWD